MPCQLFMCTSLLPTSACQGDSSLHVTYCQQFVKSTNGTSSDSKALVSSHVTVLPIYAIPVSYTSLQLLIGCQADSNLQWHVVSLQLTRTRWCVTRLCRNKIWCCYSFLASLEPTWVGPFYYTTLIFLINAEVTLGASIITTCWYNTYKHYLLNLVI